MRGCNFEPTFQTAFGVMVSPVSRLFRVGSAHASWYCSVLCATPLAIMRFGVTNIAARFCSYSDDDSTGITQ